jgi:hypothetical protein
MEHGLIGVHLPSASRSANNKITVPGRLHDNIQSGFVLWLGWQEICASSAQLEQYIAVAKVRSPKLIVNTRERRLHNG